ncbi:MAG: DUF6377 domain-containing protein [Rikenellaceae bacterium]
MRYLLYLIFIICSPHLFAQSRIDAVLSDLDSKIKERNQYRLDKDRRINALKFTLATTDDPSQQYRICHNIFEEYKVYQYDSAYIYALKTSDLARVSGDKNSIAQSDCDLLFCYSTVGLFKEAADVVANFSEDGVSRRVMANFYEESFRLYSNLISYVGDTGDLAYGYKQQMIDSSQQAVHFSNPTSFKRRFLEVQSELFIIKDYEASATRIEKLLNTHNLSLHIKAILYSWLGLCHEMLSDRDGAIYSIALSVIADIESCTYETTSAQVLARYMFERGDITRASSYINLALEEANIYNSHIRKLEIQSIMPTILAQRYEDILRDRGRLIIYSSLIIALAILVIFMLIKIYRSNTSLRIVRSEVEQRAVDLALMNSRLLEVNRELEESNRIKDLYIIESLYGDSHFVDNVDKMCKVLIRKIKAKQFSDILEVVGGMGIKRERQRMSSAFDSAFIKLFPNFIEEYNKLFAPEDAISLGEAGELPTEVRIFALIRLGVDDASQIAKYLNLSLNTVYVYKAKVKARAIHPKEEFENRIKSIA